MTDEFIQELWKLGADNPKLQEVIARSITGDTEGYSIPTRKLSKSTDELETIHITIYEDIQDPAIREKATALIKKADSARVGDIEKILGLLRIDLIAKQARGEKLTRVEETLKDIDLSSLVFTALLAYSKIPKTFESPEAFKKEWEQVTGNK